MIFTERLANGATLLLEPVDRTDTLCIGFWFLHGSRDESPGERGYSHFLEHMLFKGTGRRTRPGHRAGDRPGRRDHQRLHRKRDHLRLRHHPAGAPAARLRRPLRHDRRLAPGRIGNGEGEGGHRQRDPLGGRLAGGEGARPVTCARCGASTPSRARSPAKCGEVERIGRADLVRFYRERLVPVEHDHRRGGQFPGSTRCASLAAAVFAVGCRLAERHRAASAPSWRRKVSFVPDRFNQVQIYAGTCYPLDHDLSHYYTSLVFSTAFGESMSCRLFQKLREELGALLHGLFVPLLLLRHGHVDDLRQRDPGQTRELLAALDAGARAPPQAAAHDVARSTTRRATSWAA